MLLINKFFKGDLKLWQSFWLVFSTPCTLFLTDKVHNFIIPREIYPYAYSFYSITIRLSTFICFLLILLFLAYGTWKSAKKYEGSKWLKWLSQLVLIANGLLILLAFVFTSNELFQIDSEYYPYDLSTAIKKTESPK
jgi:ABC-type Fe3+ transport system permease subunit